MYGVTDIVGLKLVAIDIVIIFKKKASVKVCMAIVQVMPIAVEIWSVKILEDSFHCAIVRFEVTVGCILMSILWPLPPYISMYSIR